MDQSPRPQGVNPYGSPAPAPRRADADGSFKDRRGALTVFGILEILLGALFLLVAVASLAGQVVSARMMEQEANYRQAAPSVIFYLILSGAMVGVGLGSIAAKRWARNLSLILAWSWLATGVLALAILAYSLPRVLDAISVGNTPSGAGTVLIVVTLAITGVFFVVLPGVLVIFYRSRHVKATVEHYDRGNDWTTRCPLQVLTLSLWTLIGALFAVASAIAVNGAMPFFGLVVAGAPGTLLYLGLAASWTYAAWRLYQTSIAGWWIVFASTLVCGVSGVVTFLRIEPMTLYRDFGYTEAQIEAMRQMGTLSGGETALVTAAMVASFLAYLVCLRKYFTSASD